MDDNRSHDPQTYAVFLYPEALETLGEAIKPYMHEGRNGPHLLCNAIDTGGALIQMTMDARTSDGEPVQMQLMLPGSMVRMIVSARSDEVFGFSPRVPVPAGKLPPVGEDEPKTG